MTYELSPGVIYRMPTHFGPAPGPRQHPDGRRRQASATRETSTAWVRAVVDSNALDALLPPGFTRPAGQATIKVKAQSLRGVEWLAGRGYDLVEVSTPVRYTTADGDRLPGDLALVLWENRADPIISGREELGFPKLFADIAPIVVDIRTPSVRTGVSWDGYTFLALEVTDLVDDPAPAPTPPMLHCKYLPATGDWGAADSSYVTLTPPDNPLAVTVRRTRGTGSLRLDRATFEQLPTLLHVVNGLCDLRPGPVVEAGAQRTVGAKTLDDQRRLA